MVFLHESELHFHGNLTSSNCLVTSRWSLQVADFGLLTLRRRRQDADEEHAKYQRMLWCAPEVLRDRSATCGSGSVVTRAQKADVYAFGIILYEIIGRRGPYGDIELSPKGTLPMAT